MDEASLEVGTVLGERYAVEGLVGLGGLAEVYRVRHLELGSVHALKLLTWNRKSLTERLLLEGRIQAQLTHPHIVRVTDVVRIDNRVALLLEFIEGPSLEEFLDHHGPLSVVDALGLFAPILAAVAHAHDAGVLHRDLKPANVLLVRAPGSLVPKVTDFGLAKVVEEGLGLNTRTGVSMGTPGYMPPEQVRNSASADVRTDIFALGTLIYEMIAGRKAFAPPEGGEIELTATIDRTPEPLDAVAPGLWPAIARALDPDRERRYADARAFARALGIEDHPSLAASPDLVRVPLALDPSTYPSNPSGEPSPATMAPSAAGRERRTAGPIVVGLVLGSVAVSVLVTALMTQPVLESRRAQRERAEPAPPVEAIEPAAVAPGPAIPPLEPVVGPEAPVASRERDVPVSRPDDDGVAERAAVVDPDAATQLGRSEVVESSPDREGASITPAPKVIEVVEAVAAAPSPAPAALSAPSGDEAAEDDDRERKPPFEVLPVGRYVGEAGRIALELRVWDSTGGRVTAEVLFITPGSPTPRSEKLDGTFDPTTRRLELASPTSSLVFEGQRTGPVIEGQYRRGSRKSQPWRVTMQ